jgi:GNAT superfamily N-acetyltransferase
VDEPNEMTADGFAIRDAGPEEAQALAVLISKAYEVEAFFKIGDRTNAVDVRDRMRRGRFLVIDGPDGLAGCVYVVVHGERGYFGLLSIDPNRQKRGLGARLIAAAEDACRTAGCREMEIEVVNLRTELPPFYRRFGYRDAGTRPFPDGERATRPCHFIVMAKPLR